MECDVIKHLSDLDSKNKQVNLVDWHIVIGDDDEHKRFVHLDIRTWKKNPDGKEYPAKGICLDRKQALELKKVLDNLDFNEISIW